MDSRQGLALAVGLIAVVVFSACGGGSQSTRGAPTEDGSQPTTAIEPTPEATRAPAPTPTIRPTILVTGLREEPLVAQPPRVTKTLGPRPDSVFPTWDRRHTVVYDTASGKAIELGEGSGANFSLDSRWAAWIAGPLSNAPSAALDLLGEAKIQNLETGERRTFGQGRAIVFVDAQRVAVLPPERGLWKVYDFATGKSSADQTTPGRTAYRLTPEGNQLWVTPVKGSEFPRGGNARNTFDLRGPSGALILQFQAVAAIPSAPNELVVATAVQAGLTNIYVLHTDTGVAEPVTNTRYGNGPNWPFSATASAILWTEAFCSDQQGHMVLFDRASKTLVEIEDGIAPGRGDEHARSGSLKPGGVIALGPSDSNVSLIDAATLQYVAVLPPVVPADRPTLPVWSPDYRYASYTSAGGRGGLC